MAGADDMDALIAGVGEVLEQSATLTEAMRVARERFPNPPIALEEIVTLLLGGDTIIRVIPPTPGSLRAKFWAEILAEE